jgi:hypothetical protein
MTSIKHVDGFATFTCKTGRYFLNLPLLMAEDELKILTDLNEMQAFVR